MNRRRLKQRNRCVETHLAMVHPIASFYARQTGQNFDDLTQVGRLGLIRASQLYQSSRGIPFEVFARPHIRGAILHYLRDCSGLIRLPRRIEERAQGILRSGEAASDPDQQLILALYRGKTQWSPLKGNEGKGDHNAVDQIQDEDRARLIRTALRELQPAERKAITAVILKGLSLRTAASRQHVSAMTVQRRVKRGLRQLKQTLSPHQSLL